MPLAPHDVSIAQSPELFRRQINQRLPNYGDTLPDVDLSADGTLFVLTPGKVLYQLQNGAWETVP